MKTNRMGHALALATLGFFLLYPAGAHAELKPGTINITSSIGGSVVDGGLNYDSGMNWGLAAGLNISEELGVEFNYNSIDSESDGHSGKIMLYRFDVLLHLSGLLSDKTVPYVSLGTGFSTLNNSGPGSHKEFDLIFDPGFGVKHYLSKNFALRGDARYILEHSDDLHHNLLYNIGITVEFGFDEAPPPAPVPAPAEPEPVVEELCPGGPEGCVEKDWCKKDSDGDGVADCMDKCPDTPKGTAVDAHGCPPVADQGVIIFRNIQFDFDKSIVKQRSYAVLDDVVAYMEVNKGVKMEIQGHTDNKGTAVYNKKLSYRRADSVRKYMVGKGIAPERLKVSGFGFDKPVVPNNSDENRSLNRRVEFKPF